MFIPPPIPFFSITANPAPRVAGGGGGTAMGAYGMSISSLKMKAFSGEIQVAATKKSLLCCECNKSYVFMRRCRKYPTAGKRKRPIRFIEAAEGKKKRRVEVEGMF